MILNVRPALYRKKFHEAFGPIGLPIVDCPVLIPGLTGVPVPPPEGFDAIIFTSQAAAELLRWPPGWFEKTAYAVGLATAEAARVAGFKHVIQTGANAKDVLGRRITEASFARALYPSAEDVTADLALEFPGRVERLTVYRMAACEVLPQDVAALILGGGAAIVPLFSRRSAAVLERLLADAGVNASNSRLAAVAISGDVFTSAGGPWHSRAVADNPTLEAVAAKAREIAADIFPA